MQSEWKTNGGIRPNEVLDGGAFFISYTDNRCPQFLEHTLKDTQMKLDSTQPETALVIRGGKGKGINRYLIVRGDHRSQYEALVPIGLDACIQYFKDQRELLGGHFWSDCIESEDEPLQNSRTEKK